MGAYRLLCISAFFFCVSSLFSMEGSWKNIIFKDNSAFNEPGLTPSNMQNIFQTDSTYWLATNVYTYGMDKHFSIREKYSGYDIDPSSIGDNLRAHSIWYVAHPQGKNLLMWSGCTAFEKKATGWEKCKLFPDNKKIEAVMQLKSGKLAVFSSDSAWRYNPDDNTIDARIKTGAPTPGFFLKNIATIGDTVYYDYFGSGKMISFDFNQIKSYNMQQFAKLDYWMGGIKAFHDTLYFAINDVIGKAFKIFKLASDSQFTRISIPMGDSLLKKYKSPYLTEFAIDYKGRFWLIVGERFDPNKEILLLDSGKIIDPCPERNKSLLYNNYLIKAYDKKIIISGFYNNEYSAFVSVYDEDPDGLGVEKAERYDALFFHSMTPIPAKSSLVLTYGADEVSSGNISARVFDFFGNEINKTEVLWTEFNNKTGYGRLEIDLHGLANGIYIVRVTNGNNSFAKSFVVMN